jgi:hypothetical protein
MQKLWDWRQEQFLVDANAMRTVRIQSGKGIFVCLLGLQLWVNLQAGLAVVTCLIPATLSETKGSGSCVQ